MIDKRFVTLLERTVSLTHAMLEEAKKKGYQRFDEILLVGGSSRMPQVAARVKQEFAMDPKMFDPDEAIAKGAALYGWKLSINDELTKRIATKWVKKPRKCRTLVRKTWLHFLKEA